MRLTHIFAPANNTRISHLCGPLDENLRTIEKALGVKIARRHEQFKVEGSKAHATQAMELLQAAYEMADKPLNAEKLQLMLAGDAALIRADLAQGINTHKVAVRGRTANQVRYLDAITEHDITFGVGPAGTGKTWLAVACAIDALERNSVQRIVLTRPAVEAGERLGFLPGDLAQKVDPYLRPLYDALYDLMGFDRVSKLFEKNLIEIAPLAYMRGRTLNHAFIILDEAQNTSPEQMKMFLTRIGIGSRAVITGDLTQVDLPRGQKSGLAEAVQVLADVRGVAFTRFLKEDVVRHPLVARIVAAYETHSQRNQQQQAQQ